MPVEQVPIRRIAALLLAATACACGSSGTGDFNVIAIGEPDDPFETGIRLSPGGQLARASTVEGLVAFDAEGRVIPALADRWIVTDDGRSYIFRLRDGTWRDGSEITSSSARNSLRKVLRSLRGTSLGLDLSGIEEIREMAGRVIEIRLNRPMPHFLQILAQPELGLAHKGSGAGPMDLERQDDLAILSPINPKDLGMPEIRNWQERARPIRFAAMNGADAVAKFNDGDADLVLGGRIGDFPLTRSVGILRGTIQLDPVAGLFGLLATHTNGFLSEPANREAIAMAIDREALIVPFGVDGWKPSTRLVTPELEGDPGTVEERWADMTMEDRKAVASARVVRWRADSEGEGPVTLRIRLPEGLGSDMLFERLAADLGAVGLEAKHAGKDEPADLRLVDTVARYPRSTWFLNRLNCKVVKGACNSDADKKVAQAERAETEAERAELLAEAEAELTGSNVFIPFGPPMRWSLVRGSVDAFATNRWGWHPLMPMALLPK